ncbi:ClpP family protease [Bacillus infantis]|uniref:ClpP family protease n=1 Tax=Bacillus infantis TaxID=324767 RepID=UPI0013EB0B2C|nr:ATP-dependent Clp protease proteolytic subunit [Bacillus infantis]
MSEQMKSSAVYYSIEEVEFLNHLKGRKLILNDVIDDDIVEKGILQIFRWNEEDKDLAVEDRKPISIILNSGGGAVDIGMVFCEVVRKSKTPVHITVLGCAASMAALILMAGHVRKAYSFSNILIHDGSMFLGGTTGKVKDHMKFQEEKEVQIKKYVLETTKISSEKYDEMYDREWWMTAETAKEFGLIDELI